MCFHRCSGLTVVSPPTTPSTPGPSPPGNLLNPLQKSLVIPQTSDPRLQYPLRGLQHRLAAPVCLPLPGLHLASAQAVGTTTRPSPPTGTSLYEKVIESKGGSYGQCGRRLSLSEPPQGCSYHPGPGIQICSRHCSDSHVCSGQDGLEGLKSQAGRTSLESIRGPSTLPLL